MELRDGAVLNQYGIQSLIAEGGMGSVWRAWDSKRNGFVAIKVVSNDLLADPNFKSRFIDEVQRHSRLSHPNIVPVLDVFEQDGQSFCVMQLIEGRSLAALLKSKPQGRLSLEESSPILTDVLMALDFAHRSGIIHRDIKPSNVLLDQDGRAHLIDFGIALAVGEQRRTRTGLAVGTPHYMSPEQIRRPKGIDHRSDVYSVGCVFYEMLTGRPPFQGAPGKDGDTDFAIKEAHIKQAPIPPCSLVPEIPKAIDRLILKALAKDATNRIPGCQEFLRLLEEARKPQGWPGTLQSWADRCAAWIAANPGPFSVVLAVLLLVAVAAIVFALFR